MLGQSRDEDLPFVGFTSTEMFSCCRSLCVPGRIWAAHGNKEVSFVEALFCTLQFAGAPEALSHGARRLVALHGARQEPLPSMQVQQWKPR